MNWTPEEIRGYHQIQVKELSSLYDKVGISENNPQKREEYLKKRLRIDAFEEGFIKNFSGKEDNPAMLNILERMAISEGELD